MNLDTVFQIIDDYNQPAFEACSDALYDILGYKVLQRKDIRKIDLKEKLAVYLTSANMTENLEKLFVSSAEPLVRFHVEIVPGSERIKKYDLLRKKTADSLTPENSPISTLENYVLIYLAQFRSHMKLNNSLSDCKIQISDAEYCLYKNDIDVLNYIKNYCHIIKQESRKKLIGKQVDIKIHRLNQEQSSLIYIIGILIFYRILQFEGEI